MLFDLLSAGAVVVRVPLVLPCVVAFRGRIRGNTCGLRVLEFARSDAARRRPRRLPPGRGHLISRAVRFWRPGHGRDEAVLCALASVPVASDTVEEPGSREELARQLTVERAVSRAHLATVKAQFYDRDWRRENNHDGIHPEDHLWWATAGYLDLDDAIAALDG